MLSAFIVVRFIFFLSMFVVAFFQCCICICFCFFSPYFQRSDEWFHLHYFQTSSEHDALHNNAIVFWIFFPCVLTDLDELKHRVLLNSMLNSNRMQDCFFSLVLFLFRENIVIYVKRISKFTFWSLECNEWTLQGDGIYGITSWEKKSHHN